MQLPMPATPRNSATSRSRVLNAKSSAVKTPTSRSKPRCSRSPACSGFEYVFVYPESGDLVLAGPAGDWKVAKFGRVVSADTGEPIVRLDDLLVLLRRSHQSPDSYFGCMINPRQESLAQTQEYLNKTSSRPLEPTRRDAWIAKLRELLGKQDIEVFGVDPASRIARVLVEADYHMKLIGMGLADGVGRRR